MQEVAAMLQMSKVRKDRKARSEICPECEVERDTARPGDLLARDVRSGLFMPPRMA